MPVGTKRSSKERRFTCYNALEVSIRRGGVLSPGATATLILEAFLEDRGRIVASKAVARGLCKEGEFWQWRKTLIEKGWLQWSQTQQDKGQYFPGKKLMPYVNKEILAQKEIATRESVEQVRAEKADRSEFQETKKKLEATSSKLEETSSKLEATNRALAEIADSVRELQEALIPPETPAKKKARERAMDRIAARATAN
jgi:dGTP triphosphohydrolase